jgi:uncharacterized protein (TIGR03086 family)
MGARGMLRLMVQTAADIYRSGLDFATSVIDRFPGDAWDRPSPCAEWRALDVLGHLGATTRFGIQLLEGEQPAWQPASPPGDSVEGDPKEWWRGLADRARQVMSGVDLTQTVETPGGRRTIGEGLSFPAVDLYLHGWDLARSVGVAVEIPGEAIDFAHSVLDPIPDEQLRGPSTFGPEVPVGSAATSTAAFVAWAGRDPAWSTPGR